jgi:hypothetical protein
MTSSTTALKLPLKQDIYFAEANNRFSMSGQVVDRAGLLCL